MGTHRLWCLVAGTVTAGLHDRMTGASVKVGRTVDKLKEDFRAKYTQD